MEKHEDGFGGAAAAPGSCPQQINIAAAPQDQLHFWSQPVGVAFNYFLFAWPQRAMVAADSSSSLTAQLRVTSKPVLEVVGI